MPDQEHICPFCDKPLVDAGSYTYDCPSNCFATSMPLWQINAIFKQEDD